VATETRVPRVIKLNSNIFIIFRKILYIIFFFFFIIRIYFIYDERVIFLEWSRIRLNSSSIRIGVLVD
jgi:hypothetical protein